MRFIRETFWVDQVSDFETAYETEFVLIIAMESAFVNNGITFNEWLIANYILVDWALSCWVEMSSQNNFYELSTYGQKSNLISRQV